MKTAELIARAQTGDLASRDQVIADNLKLAWHVAGRFCNTGHDLEELSNRFHRPPQGSGALRLSRGVEFSTFAVPCMIGEIRQFLRRISLSTWEEPAGERQKVKQAAEKLRADGTEPTVGSFGAHRPQPGGDRRGYGGRAAGALFV